MIDNKNQAVLQPLVHQEATPMTEKHKAAEQIVEAIGDSYDVLVRATTVFPFTLFPDTITVDRSKLSITRRTFFKLAEVLSIRIEDILNVTANVGPFLGSVSISTRFYDANKSYPLNFLTRGDALKVKRIVLGYLIAMQKEVDCSALSTRELAALLDELGKVAPQEKG